jgi:hypothetical protein
MRAIFTLVYPVSNPTGSDGDPSNPVDPRTTGEDPDPSGASPRIRLAVLTIAHRRR